MSRLDADALIKEVKENIAKLNGCAGPHNFQPHEKYDSGMVKKYRCTRCQGTVSATDRNWYMRGLGHGGRVTFFEDKVGTQMVELSTRRYNIVGDELVEYHLHGPDPTQWVLSERTWKLNEIVIKSTLPISDKAD